MGLPVEVVERPVSLKRAVERQAGYDLVLIDTAGRNQLRQQLDEVGTALSLVKPDYTLLLVGMNTRAQELEALLAAYRPLGYNRLVAAKIDEALDTSGLLDLSAAGQAPLSYLTTGQLVPDDLEEASPEQVMAALMGRWRP
jgi:flagellar biosynthesis protein FlhF